MQSKLVRWPRLLVAAISMLFAGVIYAWSVLKAPLGTEFGWTPSQLALNFTLTLCFFCIGGLIGSKLSKTASPKVALWVGAVLVAIGFIMASRLNGSVAMLYISYAGFAGLGIGITYNVVISSTNAWYPDRKGMCSGVMMMCFGLSSLILGKVADAMFASEAFGWRKTYMILGIVIAVIIAVCAFGVRMPEPGTTFPKPQAKGKQADEGFEPRDYTTSEALRRSSFWRFFIYSILTCGIYSIYWQYQLAKRMDDNAPRYGVTLTEHASDVLLWLLLGTFICVFLSYVGVNYNIKNLNTMSAAYNRANGLA